MGALSELDFTLITYLKLIQTLNNREFSFHTFSDFLHCNYVEHSIVIRHDVDSLSENSLKFARIQAEMGISSTFYFRAVPESFNENIIREIHKLEHEIGYHYEDVSSTAKRFTGSMARRRSGAKGRSGEAFEKELVDIAIESFLENLEKLRKIAPVKTICMHGSPMSRWDSRLLWKYYDYHDFGITGEPYFDLDFEEVLYLTDTGRRWDGDSVSVRDKGLGTRNKGLDFKDKVPGESINRSESEYFKDWKVKPVVFSQKTNSAINLIPNPYSLFPNQRFHSTSDIIKAAKENRLPDKIMMTFHPQRWTDKPLPWVKELVWQNLKNSVKYFVVRNNSHW